MDIKKEHINVCIRIRPVLSQDSTASSSLQIINKEPSMLLVTERNQIFNFDHIFPEDSNQEKVYFDAVEPLVNCIKMGYNGTVFAYGQTGTGKTYTMGSGSQKPDNDTKEGIIPRALKQLFDEDKENREVQIFVTFCEIYNEKVFDLLTLDKTPLPVSGFSAPNLIKKSVINVTEANKLLELGNKNRHVGETKQNSSSSRSHAIFTVEYENKHQNTTAKLNLVDLAGSESTKKNGTKGKTFKEGININKGLLTLGQVIKALSIKSTYIPYRESMITTILHDSLNFENYISLIACVSANPEDVLETMQTLDFAQKAKKIKSNPIVNSIVDKFNKENGFGRTPMKRATPFKTIAKKKFIGLPLSAIDETESNNDQFSIASNSNSILTREVLSPIVRKYTSELEEKIVSRLTTALKINRTRPASSSTPIEDKSIIAQRLVFSPEINDDEDVFKMPINPVAQNNRKMPMRRSLRLSMKRQHEDDDDEAFINKSRRRMSPIISMSPAPIRRSLRLSSIRRNSVLPEQSIRKASVTPIAKAKGRKTVAARVLVERALKISGEGQMQDSPYTNHSNKVLNVLNFGNKSQIEKLHFVGSKTAEQVLLFRKLNGQFTCIEDLRPTLGPKRFQTFLQKNFLKIN